MGLFSIFRRESMLYYPGCMAYFKYKWNLELYKKIFSKLGINLVVDENFLCCGLLALELGYEAEARKLVRKNFENFKEKNHKKIITSCPSCYKMFIQNYQEFLPDWDIETVNLWELVFEKLINKPKLIKKIKDEKIGYHDSCYLGRYCQIYEEPRRILELIGYKIEEMPNSKEKSLCCGSCGGLTITNPELADKIARQRLLEAKQKGIKKLIVGSLQNYELLKKNSEGIDIEILELSEVLAEALGIKVKIEEDFEEEEVIDLNDVGKENE